MLKQGTSATGTPCFFNSAEIFEILSVGPDRVKELEPLLKATSISGVRIFFIFKYSVSVTQEL